MRVVIMMITLFLLSSCSLIKDVKPWEKENLAKENIKANGGNSLVGKFVNHTYFSKEASKGGGGVAGGGCGCN